jgi:retinol-binding protein 3
MKKPIAILLCLLLIDAGSRGVQAQTVQLTKTLKSGVVGSLSKSLLANYVYLDTAKKMASFIGQQLRSGAYDTIQSGSVFAARLTSDLLSVYPDGHLSISVDPSSAKPSGAPDTLGEQARRLQFKKRVNYGFEKAEILPGNIGYLKIGGFFPSDSDVKMMTLAAFRFVSNARVLVLDLRENHGGDPRTVSYICGFLFPSKTHLNDLFTRSDQSTEEFWAVPDSSLTALQTVPVYVLTSKQTFSAGEELSYDLQTQKRATIIGEVTGGGAHPVRPFPIGSGFTANIPFARAINPVTKQNWEAVGVHPDIVVPAADALSTAVKVINQ